MQITLKPDQEALIHSKLQSGKYQSVDEIIQAALRLLDTQDKAYELWEAETRAKVNEGIASLESGEGINGETFIHQLITELKQAN